MKSKKLLDLIKSAVAVAVVLTAGCATATPVMKADESQSGFQGAVYEGEIYQVNADTPGSTKYRLFHQGSSGFTSVESVKISATKEMEGYCAKSGTVPEIITEQSSKPPHILGNFPRVEFVFVCIPGAQMNGSISPVDVKYDRLTKEAEGAP